MSLSLPVSLCVYVLGNRELREPMFLDVCRKKAVPAEG